MMSPAPPCRMQDWSCSPGGDGKPLQPRTLPTRRDTSVLQVMPFPIAHGCCCRHEMKKGADMERSGLKRTLRVSGCGPKSFLRVLPTAWISEEHTSELQS